MPTQTHTMILEVKNVTQRFGGITALRDVTLSVEAATVHGLIGPNGAGKTTLINVISGRYRPQAGRILYHGREITGHPRYRLAQCGLMRTFQANTFFPGITVEENLSRALSIGAYRHHSNLPLVTGTPRERDPRRDLEYWTDRMGLHAWLGHMADSLPHGQKRLLGIAMALASDPELLLLDEPAAGLTEGEAGTIGALILELRDSGMTIVLVEHNVPLVMRVCQRISVLNYGHVLEEGAPAAIQTSPAVIEAYLGTGVE